MHRAVLLFWQRPSEMSFPSWKLHPQHRKGLRRALAVLAALALLWLLALWYLSAPTLKHLPWHLVLHSLLEGTAIVIAALVFAVGWNACRMNVQRNVLLLACGFLGVALLDAAHTLSYQGMPDYVTPNSVAKGILFWLPARYLAASVLLLAVLAPWRALQPGAMPKAQRWGLLVLALAVVAMVHVLVIFFSDALPLVYAPPAGLTDFKIAAEYGVVALHLLTLGVLLWRMRGPTAFDAPALFAAVGIMALGEVFFTRYVRATDQFNLLGHVYKVLGYLYLYRAIFQGTIEAPYRALAQSEQKLQTVLDAIPDLLFELTRDGRYLRAPRQREELLAVPVSEILERKVDEVLPPPAAATVHAALDEAHARGRSEGHQFTLQLADGEHWFEISVARVQTDDWEEPRFVLLSRDITARVQALEERRRNEERIRHLANFDVLTGLPNRSMFGSRFVQALALSQRSHAHLALLHVDLDRFKTVNDSLGTDAGDALLIDIARRLQAQMRPEDTVARYGGDEFFVALPLTNAQEAAQRAEALLAELRKSSQIAGQALVVTSSIGIAMYPEDGQDMQTLMQRAEAAMDKAKALGRDHYCFFSPEMQTASAHVLRIENALRTAIAQGQLSLHFQPQWRLQDGRLVGAEALLRWTHPELGRVSPAEFIPVAEASGQIIAIGQWVLDTALAQLRRWRDAGHAELTLAVNLSLMQFRQPDLLTVVQQALARVGVPAQALELELTESIAMQEPEKAIATVQQLAAAGVQLSLDDFGTGYSSFSYLQRLQVHCLKIDHSFVSHIEAPRGLAVVRAIIDVAAGLGLQTIAEGVETPAQLAALRTLGCDMAQGYLLARPLPQAEFEALLARQASGQALIDL